MAASPPDMKSTGSLYHSCTCFCRTLLRVRADPIPIILSMLEATSICRGIMLKTIVQSLILDNNIHYFIEYFLNFPLWYGLILLLRWQNNLGSKNKSWNVIWKEENKIVFFGHQQSQWNYFFLTISTSIIRSYIHFGQLWNCRTFDFASLFFLSVCSWLTRVNFLWVQSIRLEILGPNPKYLDQHLKWMHSVQAHGVLPAKLAQPARMTQHSPVHPGSELCPISWLSIEQRIYQKYHKIWAKDILIFFHRDENY